ncbi:MAG: site-specific integrase, partial [Clostridiales bacterium]|nr:site-specific integrase [Clostridiales bacterium]
MNYRAESPQVLLDFLSYHETVKGHSQGTVDEYFLDLRSFFRYMKLRRGLVPADTEFEKITIQDIDIDFLRGVSLSEIYDYLSYLTREGHLNNASRARKVSTLRSFFKFLSTKTHLLEDNPIEGLDTPKVKKDLPRYLTLDESIQLLESVDGANQERDYCILTLFL